MQTFIAILRGINVGRKRKIKMADLRKNLKDLGYENIRTYIQSGNVIFKSHHHSKQELEEQIESMIREEYEFNVPAIVKTSEELHGIWHGNPYVNERNEDIAKLHVTFLTEAPTQIQKQAISEIDQPTDEFVVDGEFIYLFCPEGYGRTKFNNQFFERKLDVKATTRNWKTVRKLYEMSNTE